jgi:hypothetical protein
VNKHMLENAQLGALVLLAYQMPEEQRPAADLKMLGKNAKEKNVQGSVKRFFHRRHWFFYT